jgi:hypothetical protein
MEKIRGWKGDSKCNFYGLEETVQTSLFFLQLYSKILVE